MRLSITACALFALAAAPGWAESAAPSNPHHPAGVATPSEAPAPNEDQSPSARPDMLQLMMEHAETHAIDHGEDHSNCCKVKKPAQ